MIRVTLTMTAAAYKDPLVVPSFHIEGCSTAYGTPPNLELSRTVRRLSDRERDLTQDIGRGTDSPCRPGYCKNAPARPDSCDGSCESPYSKLRCPNGQVRCVKDGKCCATGYPVYCKGLAPRPEGEAVLRREAERRS